MRILRNIFREKIENEIKLEWVNDNYKPINDNNYIDSDEEVIKLSKMVSRINFLIETRDKQISESVRNAIDKILWMLSYKVNVKK